MRDARPQSGQIRGLRRDRAPAGRRSSDRERVIDLTFVSDAGLRLAGAIALATLAFIVWNVGTRPPLAVVRDIARGFRSGRVLFAGTVSALVGFIFLIAATVLLLPAIPDPTADFAPAEIFTFVVALAIEHLIGGDVRAIGGARE